MIVGRKTHLDCGHIADGREICHDLTLLLEILWRLRIVVTQVP